MGETVLAEPVCAFLRVAENSDLGGVPGAGVSQAGADLCVGEPDRSRFIEVVNDLAVQPGPLDGDRGEVPLIQERPDQVGHVVLGRF